MACTLVQALKHPYFSEAPTPSSLQSMAEKIDHGANEAVRRSRSAAAQRQISIAQVL
jgi:hypothetical protein